MFPGKFTFKIMGIIDDIYTCTQVCDIKSYATYA